MIQYDVDIFYLMLYAGVTFVAATACCYLLFRRGNAFAPDIISSIRLRRWAAAFFAVMVLSHVWWFQLEFFRQYPDSLAFLAIAVGLDGATLIITVAGILLSMLQDRRRSLLPVILSLLPLLVGLAVCIIRHDETFLTISITYFQWLVLASLLYFVYHVRQYSYWLRDNYADLEHKEVWKSLLVLAIFFLFFGIYGNNVSHIAYAYLIQVNDLILIALLLWRVETLQQLEPISQEETVSINTQTVSEGALTIPSNIGALLKDHCEKKQLYLHHDITLDELSKAIGTNRTYLSTYFTLKGISYNAYINRLRIQHFVKLYRERKKQKQQFTALELANESGFRSYATFGLSFKRFMGQTVTSWMKEDS
ncbi:MAG: AraC family transcriptional regulator [Prevotella sp.]|nr:AraC family transcriptional regulator [Prevotella sp.]